MSIYLERHAQALLGSLGRLARQPFATFLTIVVIGIALALPAALYLVVSNMRIVTEGLDDTVQLSVYFRMSTTGPAAKKVATAIAARNDVEEAVLVSPEEGLAEFRKRSGIGEALQALPENPLPWLAKVRPAPPNDTAAAVEALAADLRKLEGVELVEADTALVRRLHAIEDTMQQLVLLVAAVLAAGVLAVVGNTIRLEINSRRAEIEVTKLVGGSNAFVRRPFLYNGVWYGVGGALVAGLIVAVVVIVLSDPVRRIAGLYGSEFHLQGIGFFGWGALLLGGAALGWLGSFIVATRELREIEPK